MRIIFNNIAEAIQVERWFNNEVTDECLKGGGQSFSHKSHCSYDKVANAITDAASSLIPIGHSSRNRSNSIDSTDPVNDSSG
jgi:hypothetical protein